MRLLISALFLEIGLVLTVTPWSRFWDRNYFADVVPLIGVLVTNDFVRGAVTGLGLVNIAVAASELWSMFAARRPDDPILSITRHPEEPPSFAEASAEKP